MTTDYLNLYAKCWLFAQVFGYELVAYEGTFSFYDSPDFRSFRFHVDPDTFITNSVEWFLYKKFEGRMCADGQIQ